MAEFLDTAEAKLLDDALAALEGREAERQILLARLRGLEQASALLAMLPSLRSEGHLAGVTRSESTLIEHLVAVDHYRGPLGLPAKGTLAHAFLVLKVATFKAFRVGLDGRDARLDGALAREIAQSIYTLLAEELLRSMVFDRQLAPALRRRAARVLVELWDEAAVVEIDDFCPVLELAWSARARAGVVLGTMLGTVEYFRLVQQDCPEAVLAFFSRGEIPDEESQAFEEFLLSLPWDDVTRLRERMRLEQRACIDARYAVQHLSVPPMQLEARDDPDALYASFRRRLRHAELRRATGDPGPRRTAEAYLMMHLLSS